MSITDRPPTADQLAFDMTPAQLVPILKETGEDFEFYPTTNEIIRALARDVDAGKFEPLQGWERRRGTASLLDVGAGNGKVLRAMREAGKSPANQRGNHCGRDHFTELYAIEKSAVLRQQLDADIFVVGTDFQEQSLLSKSVDVIFSNPPYSEFVPWTVKILRESAAWLVYLVVPVRWRESQAIAEAIAFRKGKTKIVGEFSFEHSEDRHARAKVHLLRIELPQETDDAFERFFDEQFGHLRDKFNAAQASAAKESGERTAEQGARFNELVIGEDYPTAMVNLYNADMARVQKNYEIVGTLDVGLLREFGVEPDKILECLKTRLSGLRNVYWKEVFDRIQAITDRLCREERQQLFETLNKHAHVDFTVDNIHAVILWVIKNANTYLDSQLVSTYETMVEKANVKLYKSNRKPFEHDTWRYRNEPASRPTHFALEYRLVLSNIGGISTGQSWERGLSERAAFFLSDLLTVARNLGFQNNTADGRLTSGRGEWVSNGKKEFWWTDPATKKREVLLEVRAFKKHNCHVRMHQRLALALNVEYGRLKGWLKSGEQAAEEMDEPEAANLFRSNLALPLGDNSMLLLAAAE